MILKLKALNMKKKIFFFVYIIKLNISKMIIITLIINIFKKLYRNLAAKIVTKI